ncbi:MAG TPA: hypothetical protein VFY84_19230 [Jiangellales bacterium]|nr:hypothetical protein [Jiangellales bacterium]
MSDDWRAMGSLLVLRDQADAAAPKRSHASDGLVGDEDHQETTSDHNPHEVPGVGENIVTALDLTHDPAHGFDSYRFAEVLRTHRDKRIKYVISNKRIFSSYASGSRAAWAWGPYNGSDPHTNHVHVSVLDAAISDTRTPWNLEGFIMSEAEVITGTSKLWDQAAQRSTPTGRNFGNDVATVMNGALSVRFDAMASADQVAELIDAVEALSAKVTELTELVRQDTGAAGSYTGTATIVLDRTTPES